MRILNLTEMNSMISINPRVDVAIMAKSLSKEFQCTPRVLSSLVQAPNYQNKFRFVMDASERIITNNIPILEEVIISNSEAEEMAEKLRLGLDPFKKMDIMGKEISEESQEKKVSEFDFDRHHAKISLKSPKSAKLPNLLNKEGHKVTFTSSDEKIAKVDEKGKIDPIDKGKVTITAIADETETHIASQASYELEVTK